MSFPDGFTLLPCLNAKTTNATNAIKPTMVKTSEMAIESLQSFYLRSPDLHASHSKAVIRVTPLGVLEEYTSEKWHTDGVVLVGNAARASSPTMVQVGRPDGSIASIQSFAGEFRLFLRLRSPASGRLGDTTPGTRKDNPIKRNACRTSSVRSASMRDRVCTLARYRRP